MGLWEVSDWDRYLGWLAPHITVHVAKLQWEIPGVAHGTKR